MPQITYRGLEANGIPLIDPSHDTFAERLNSIRENSWFPVPHVQDEAAAILVNLTGQTILAFAAIWRYDNGHGEISSKRIYNLASSAQFDALLGRGGIQPHHNSFILPGSQRLILTESVYGDNNDVIPPEVRMGGSFAGAARSGASSRNVEPTHIELSLDVAFLDDGRVIGPDESGMLQALTTEFEERRTLAREMAAALRNKATPGVLFDMLRPFAQGALHPANGGYPVRHHFIHMAMHTLLHQDIESIRIWADKEAQPPRLQLRRAVT